MADNNKDSSQEKTEQPTQRKIDKAKQDGKTVSSKEMYVLSSVIMMLVFFYFLTINFSQLTSSWKNLFLLLEGVKHGVSPLNALKNAISKVLYFTIIIGVPILIVTILTQLMVGGITFSFKSVGWKNSKLNPLEWLKRTFSVKGLVELVKSILKVVLIF